MNDFKCYNFYSIDAFPSLCVRACRMPKTEELFGKSLTPLPYIPELNEMFAYKFNEIHVGRAIRLDANGQNNVRYIFSQCYSQIRIYTRICI